MMIGRFGKTKLTGILVVLADLVEKNETGASSVVVVAPVATEDDDEDDATINKWSKIRVIALKFNESTYFGYIVLAIIFIASIALVSDTNTSNIKSVFQS